jgi:hypothetical protein
MRAARAVLGVVARQIVQDAVADRPLFGQGGL